MANFASAGAAQRLRFVYRKRREVVMKHELLERLTGEQLEALLVFRGSQCGGNQSLRFAPGKQRRPVGPRQHFDFATDLPDLVVSTTANPAAVHGEMTQDRKSTRLNSSHSSIS